MPKSRKRSPRPSPRSKQPSEALAALRALANPEQARFAERYFRGGRFLGLRVPQVRTVAARFRSLTLDEIRALLASPWHEARLLAVVIMNWQYARGDEALRDALFRLYLDSTDRIDNWDLVDISAPRIVGEHLAGRGRSLLTRLAKSQSIWERRIAILATGAFMRRGEVADTFRIAKLLLRDEHDLIHKAVGWMLREAGKRDRAALERFLDEHAAAMPRVMLRYAIERLPADVRARYLSRRKV